MQTFANLCTETGLNTFPRLRDSPLDVRGESRNLGKFLLLMSLCRHIKGDYKFTLMSQDRFEPLHGEQRPHLVPGGERSGSAAAGVRRAAPLSAAQQRLRHEPQRDQRQRQEDLRKRSQKGRLYRGSFFQVRVFKNFNTVS